MRKLEKDGSLQPALTKPPAIQQRLNESVELLSVSGQRLGVFTLAQDNAKSRRERSAVLEEDRIRAAVAISMPLRMGEGRVVTVGVERDDLVLKLVLADGKPPFLDLGREDAEPMRALDLSRLDAPIDVPVDVLKGEAPAVVGELYVVRATAPKRAKQRARKRSSA